jgi:hypothetical protein
MTSDEASSAPRRETGPPPTPRRPSRLLRASDLLNGGNEKRHEYRNDRDDDQARSTKCEVPNPDGDGRRVALRLGEDPHRLAHHECAVRLSDNAFQGELRLIAS